MSQTLTVLHSFTPNRHILDGFLPDSSVLRDSAGNLYGTTLDGGTHGYGTVFKVKSSGRESILYSFAGLSDGAYPSAGLVLDLAGDLYGTTSQGGKYAEGVVFKVDTSGKESVLYSFGSKTADGSDPRGLVRDAAGNLYGITVTGGASGNGTVYKLDTAGVETVLYSFSGTGSDEGLPNPGLARDSSGNLYGTTQGLNITTSSCGTVFKMDKAGNETTLYSFKCGADGALPEFGVVRDSAGNLYGTTTIGGLNSGVVFKIDTTGAETVLHQFSGTDGQYPTGTLLRDSGGTLYGATNFGGEYGWGTIYKIDTANNETVLYSFTGGTDGKYPTGDGLVRDSAGNFYGTTQNGGSVGYGEVFKLKP